MFQGGSHTILGGVFKSTVTNINQLSLPPSSNPIPDAYVAFDAMHNSAQRFPQPHCHPGTRDAVISIINGWMMSTESTTPPILWLHGTAGVGKSAIIQTMCDTHLKPGGLIRASFFFGRGQGQRGNAACLIPTLIYQLSTNVFGCKTRVRRSLKDNPTLLKQTMESQSTWFVDMASRWPFLPRGSHIIIVVDGLDECEGDDTQAMLVDVMLKVVQKSRRPLRFLVASRPESHILRAFNKPEVTRRTKRVVLDESFEPGKAIHLFLSDEFRRIVQENPMFFPKQGSPTPWPEQGVIDLLVQAADGQFIFAQLVVRFVSEPRQSPRKQLLIILDHTRNYIAFSPLDSLYAHILSRIPATQHPILMTVLAWVLVAPEPQSADVISRIIGYDVDDIKVVQQQLRAVLKGDADADFCPPIVFAHASFRDFLVDENRSARFCLSPARRVHWLAMRSIDLAHDYAIRPSPLPSEGSSYTLFRHVFSSLPAYIFDIPDPSAICSQLTSVLDSFTSRHRPTKSKLEVFTSLTVEERVPYIFLLWVFLLHKDHHHSDYQVGRSGTICATQSYFDDFLRIGTYIPSIATKEAQITLSSLPILLPIFSIPITPSMRGNLAVLLKLFISGQWRHDERSLFGFSTLDGRATATILDDDDAFSFSLSKSFIEDKEMKSTHTTSYRLSTLLASIQTIQREPLASVKLIPSHAQISIWAPIKSGVWESSYVRLHPARHPSGLRCLVRDSASQTVGFAFWGSKDVFDVFSVLKDKHLIFEAWLIDCYGCRSRKLSLYQVTPALDDSSQSPVVKLGVNELERCSFKIPPPSDISREALVKIFVYSGVPAKSQYGKRPARPSVEDDPLKPGLSRRSDLIYTDLFYLCSSDDVERVVK